MLDRLQAGVIKAAVIENNNLDIDVVVHRTIGSTNSWSLQECRSGRALPFACFAEQQTQGRGRRGKQWLMSPASNIAMSLSWRLPVSGMQLQLLPLSIAIAVVETLESLGLAHVKVKWPNDIMVQGKKIAGILIETQPVDHDAIAVVVGIGLNYKMPVQKVLKQQGLAVFSEITDIERELSVQSVSRMTTRTVVAGILLQRVIDVMQNYLYDPGLCLEKFRAQYDYCKGKEVELVLDNGERLSGMAQGVNDGAELLVMIDAEERAFNSADVSVRAL